MTYNFYKIDTLNQGTPYDYNSVMQYEKYGYPPVCVIYLVLAMSVGTVSVPF